MEMNSYNKRQSLSKALSNQILFLNSFIKKQTSWSGGSSSWGDERIWLTPGEDNNMKDRSGFSIHGGDKYGSSGCIDLAGNMSYFLKVFEEYGTELELIVKY